MIDENPSGLHEAWKASGKAHRGMGAALERLGRFEALGGAERLSPLRGRWRSLGTDGRAEGPSRTSTRTWIRLEEAAEYYDKYFTSLQEDARNAAPRPPGEREDLHACYHVHFGRGENMHMRPGVVAVSIISVIFTLDVWSVGKLFLCAPKLCL